jgi:hypothetical protein
MATVQSTDLAVASIDWRAIVAGATAAAALSVVLFGFGSALGLSLASARPYAGLPATGIAILSALWLALVYVSTFAAGGYLAGRLRIPVSTVSKEREFRDGAHGFLVWALGTLVGAYLVASTLSAATSKTVDAAARVAEAAGQVTVGATTNGGIPDLLAYNIDKMLRPGTTPTPSATQPALAPRDVSDVVRIFGVSLANGTLAQNDKDYLASIVATRTGIPAADAGKRVDETYAAVAAKKAELEAKARSAAETARKAAILTAFLAAAVALAGLLAAAWAAGCGGRDRDEGRDLVIFGQKRLW